MPIYLLYLMCLSLFFASSAAAQSGGAAFGDLANAFLNPVGFFGNLIAMIGLVGGIAFLFAALIRYMRYRVNPLASPVSTVWWYILLGLLLLCLPILNKILPTLSV